MKPEKHMMTALASGLLALAASAATFDLSAIPDVRILRGDGKTAFRDPAVFFENGVFHLFYTWARADVAMTAIGYSTSRDLVHWTKPKAITIWDQKLNYSSPGNMIKVGDAYMLSMQTYPTPGLAPYAVKWADDTARVFTMRTHDFKSWENPVLLRVKGPNVPEAKMGRMIDPYIIRGRDGLWHCSYKQDGVSFSVSKDLQEWKYCGRIDGGENVSIVEVDDGGWVMFHSPANGIGIKRSKDLVHWTDDGLLTFGQENWPWAKGRLTAGTAIDCRKVAGIGKYLMFYHASGPRSEVEGDFWCNASLCIAWSDDLKNWSWPGKK